MNKYFFLHIPKTAGLSLFNFFRNVLPNEQVYQIREGNLGGKRAAALHSYALIGGHVTFKEMQNLFGAERYQLTFLRHPVERFLSMYYFYRSTQEEINGNLAVQKAKVLDLAEYVSWLSKSDEYESIREQQTLCLTGEGITRISKAERVAIAKENLANMDFVGITEQMADSLDLLCLDCGWPAVGKMPRENVTVKRKKMEELEKDLVERIQEFSSSDLELYAYGLNLFEQKKRQLLRESIERRVQELQGVKVGVESEEPSQRQSNSNSLINQDKMRIANDFGTREIEIIDVDVIGLDTSSSVILAGEETIIRIIFRSSIDEEDLSVGIRITDDYEQIIFGTSSVLLGKQLVIRRGENKYLEYRFKMALGEGFYHLTVALACREFNWNTCYHWREKAFDFTVRGFKGTYFQGISMLSPVLTFGHVELSDPLSAEVAAKVSLRMREIPSVISQTTRFNIFVDVENNSDYTITSNPPYPVHLSYEWVGISNNKSDRYHGIRASLSCSIVAKSLSSIGLGILSPDRPGDYYLRVTLVQEQILWFNQIAGHRFAECLVKVQ